MSPEFKVTLQAGADGVAHVMPPDVHPTTGSPWCGRRIPGRTDQRLYGITRTDQWPQWSAVHHVTCCPRCAHWPGWGEHAPEPDKDPDEMGTPSLLALLA